MHALSSNAREELSIAKPSTLLIQLPRRFVRPHHTVILSPLHPAVNDLAADQNCSAALALPTLLQMLSGTLSGVGERSKKSPQHQREQSDNATPEAAAAVSL